MIVLTIPNAIPVDLIERARAALAETVWEPGVSTAQSVAAPVKHNLQAQPAPALDALASEILFRVRFCEAFKEHVLPAHFSRPIFNRYDVGMFYGPHFDNAIIGTVRTDVSVTVFLSDDYEGGHLVVGGERHKPLAGSAVVYPTSAIHEVTPVTQTPVTQGSRLALVFWVQSLVRDPAKRALLRQLGDLVRWAGEVSPGCREAVELGQVRSNLLRLWMD